MQYKIKEKRKERDMTQVELAEKSKVARGIIVRLESQKEFATSTSTLFKLAQALDCKIEDIFLP